MGKQLRPKFILHIVLKDDSLRQCTIAHCLELDIVATAKNDHEALERMEQLIKSHIDYGFQHGLTIQQAAPGSFTNELLEGCATVKGERSDFYSDSGRASIGYQALCMA